MNHTNNTPAPKSTARQTTEEQMDAERHGIQAEGLVLGWLSSLLELPQDTVGTLTSDGNNANRIGLTCAQYRMLNGHTEGAIYCSEDTDPGVERVMSELGFADGSVQRLPCVDGRLDAFALARVVRQDRVAGRCPFCVVANAGTATSGAVDNLVLIAQVCKSEGLWLHVDGTRGGCAAMTTPGSKLLRGLAHADSLALDLQQALFQSNPLGCLLLRDGGALDETLGSRSVYAAHDDAPLLSQDVPALRLWATLRACGADIFRQRIDAQMRLADQAEAKIRERADWQVVSRSQLGIMTFRFKPAGISERDADLLQASLADDARRSGLRLLGVAHIKGHLALRICTTGPAIDEPDVQVTMKWLFRQASRIQHTPWEASCTHREDTQEADTTV